MMKIVILDGHTANPGDISWEPVRRLGQLEVHSRTSIDQLDERLEGASIVLTNKVPIGRDVLEAHPSIEFISALATGYDNIDVEAAAEHGVVVSNAPAYSNCSVAEHTFGFILELTHHIGHHSAQVHRGRWSDSPDFTFWTKPVVELRDKTIGIVGFGDIGGSVGNIADAFGMKVLGSTRSSKPEPDIDDFEWVDNHTLLERADIVTLHCPLTDETEGLIGRDEFDAMKNTALLINIARGEVLDEHALAEALRADKIAGAGIDVASEEPIPDDYPLVGLDNCVITPHVAWTSRESRRRLVEVTAENIEAFIDGEPINVVNGQSPSQ